MNDKLKRELTDLVMLPVTLVAAIGVCYIGYWALYIWVLGAGWVIDNIFLFWL